MYQIYILYNHWKFYNSLYHSTCTENSITHCIIAHAKYIFFPLHAYLEAIRTSEYLKSLLVRWEQLVLTNSCWSSLMLFVTAECPAWSVACFDGDGCVSPASLCDGRVQCRDQSDELLCAAKKGTHHTEMTICIQIRQSDNLQTLYLFLYLNFFLPS